jgi:hypothetical protein
MRFSALAFSILFLSSQAISQFPPVGIIDFYGFRKVSKSDVLSILPIKSGDDAIKTLENKETTIQKLRSIPNVEDAAIDLICCDDANGRSMIFVGIRELGLPTLRFRHSPKGTVRLPARIVQAGDAFQEAFLKLVAEKDFSEDDSEGHALFGNKDLRRVQLRFAALATPNLPILRRVIKESGDGRQRALAAQVIAYSKDKKAVVPDLAFAMSDPDGGTRNEAMRALLIIAKYALTHPELGIEVPTLPFVRMLNSLVWTDRNKSVGAIDILTIDRDSLLFSELRREALDSLEEMGNWTNPSHARAAFNILGRLAGYSESEIENMWKAPDTREAKVRKLIERIRSSK